MNLTNFCPAKNMKAHSKRLFGSLNRRKKKKKTTRKNAVPMWRKDGKEIKDNTRKASNKYVPRVFNQKFLG